MSKICGDSVEAPNPKIWGTDSYPKFKGQLIPSNGELIWKRDSPIQFKPVKDKLKSARSMIQDSNFGYNSWTLMSL